MYYRITYLHLHTRLELALNTYTVVLNLLLVREMSPVACISLCFIASLPYFIVDFSIARSARFAGTNFYHPRRAELSGGPFCVTQPDPTPNTTNNGLRSFSPGLSESAIRSLQ